MVAQQDFYWKFILGHVTLHVVLRHFFLACLTESCSFGYKRFLNHTQFVTVKTDDIQEVQGKRDKLNNHFRKWEKLISVFMNK